MDAAGFKDLLYRGCIETVGAILLKCIRDTRVLPVVASRATRTPVVVARAHAITALEIDGFESSANRKSADLRLLSGHLE